MTLSADRDTDQSGIAAASRLSGWFDPHAPARETVRFISIEAIHQLSQYAETWISARIERGRR